MARVRQKLPDAAISDIPAAASGRRWTGAEIIGSIKPGAYPSRRHGPAAAGSRAWISCSGETVQFVKALGGKPFLVPYLGSHGGAVAEGQAEILRQYGITEETMGAPVRATMETENICDLPDGTPVYIDKYAKRGRRHHCRKPHQAPYRLPRKNTRGLF